jgi:acetyl esterase/lipase
MDVYTPPDARDGQKFPAVIFVMGFHDEIISDWIGTVLKEHPCYHSWGRLVAASGMVGIAYQTTDMNDLYHVVDFIRENNEELGIDDSKIGLWSASANPPTAIAYLLSEEGKDLIFSVFHYALMSSPDGYMQDEIAAVNSGSDHPWYYPKPIGTIPSNVPLYIGIAELDYIECAPETAFHFALLAAQAGADVTIDHYGGGEHGYDFYDHSARSARMVRDSLQFMIDAFAASDDA